MLEELAGFSSLEPHVVVRGRLREGVTGGRDGPMGGCSTGLGPRAGLGVVLSAPSGMVGAPAAAGAPNAIHTSSA